MNGAGEVRMIACVSLDGFIARADRSAPDQEKLGGWTSAEDKREFWREVKAADMVIGGRRTLEQMPATGRPVALLTKHPENALDSEVDAEVQWSIDPYPSQVADFVKSFGGKRLLLCGGAMAYDLFVRWNLVDRLVLIVEPVMLRRGVRLLAPPLTNEGQQEGKYVLLKCTPLNSRGTIRLDYGRPQP